MHDLPLFFLAVLATQYSSQVFATTYLIEAYYAGTSCTGTPFLVNANESSNCSSATCRTTDRTSTPAAVGMISTECSSDYSAAIRDKFGSSPYIIQVYSPDTACTTFGTASGYPATGNCEGSFNSNDSMGVHFVGTLNANGSATMQYYSSAPCLSTQWILTESVDQEALEGHTCDSKKHKWYSSSDVTSGSSISVGAIVGIAIGCVVILVGFGAAIFRKRQSKKLQTQASLPLTTAILQSDETVHLEQISADREALWNDEVIIAKRIPRHKVKTKKFISQGAYGEVYYGQYNRKPVAVKRLVPATRGCLVQVNEFLAEAKMTATLEHPHIVSFIGVAWDSLSDLCVVLEFMDGGDLRTLLDKYLVSNHRVGFDRKKATIALHACHALTYLHSLSPPIIHRDLKSKNILLNRSLEAKLSDFGISRERLDLTMTAGVGTSLWMAPEVMLGERYGDKADMFSFGVVLSELDVHTLPYDSSKRESLQLDGRSMPHATLLQKITTGEARVEFSEISPSLITALGLACISLDPKDRPTAAEALYTLHVLLTQNMV